MRGLLLKVCNGFREKVAGHGGAERRGTHVVFCVKALFCVRTVRPRRCRWLWVIRVIRASRALRRSSARHHPRPSCLPCQLMPGNVYGSSVIHLLCEAGKVGKQVVWFAVTGLWQRSAGWCPCRGGWTRGLLEVQMGSGSYGSVCGVNVQAADIACRQLGYGLALQALRHVASMGVATGVGQSARLSLQRV